MARDFPRRAILLTWPVRARNTAGHGAGHPVLRARRPADRVRLDRRGAVARIRGEMGLAPGGGVGRPAGAQLLREPRAAGPSRGAVRPTRRRALGSHAPGPPSIDLDTRVLQSVIDACGDEPATVFACSCSAVVTASLAARAPERIRKIVFFGSFVSREDLPEATRRSIVDFVRANWPLAAQMLAGLIVPHASGDEIAALSRYQRHSAEADVAAAFLDLELHADARPFLPNVTMPALVLHRRGDRTVPISRGRELASLLPNARFVALCGDSHLPHLDDQREVQRALAGFLDDTAAAAQTNGDSPLSSREAEVLRLVAAGLRTARSPDRSCSASTPCTGTSRTSCASSRSRHAPRPRRPPPAPATSRAARRDRRARRRDRVAARSAGPRRRPTVPSRPGTRRP